MDALISELVPFHAGTGLESMSGEFHTLTAGTQILPKKKDWSIVVAGVVVGGVVAVLLAMLVATAYLGLQMRQAEVPNQAPATVVAPKAERVVAPPPEAAPPPVEPAPPAEAKPAPAEAAPKRVKPRRTQRAASKPAPPPPEPIPEVKKEAPPPPPPPSKSDWSDEDLEAGSDPWE